jgi:histidinol-phosphate aminotransferase
MLKKYVRVANAVLDLDPFELGEVSIKKDQFDISNESSRGPSPKAIEAVKRFLDKRPLSWYPDSEATELNNKISEYTKMPVEYIGCYPGTGAALDYLCRTFLEPGTEMMVSGPVFRQKLIAARTTGASVIEIRHEDPFSPEIEPVIDNIGKRTRLLYIGNPSDSIGSFFTEAELVFLLAYAEQTMVVVDESYFEFSGLSAVDLVKKFPNLAVIRSFSHAFGLAALKAGYIITDPENLNYINRLRSGDDVDAVARIAAEAVLDDTGFMLDYVEAVNQSKKIVSASLPEIGYEFYVAPANFIILKVSDSSVAVDLMKNNGVKVRDLSDIRQMRDHIRITIGDPETTDRLLLLLSRMAEKLATGFNRNKPVKSSSRLGELKTTGVGV